MLPIVFLSDFGLADPYVGQVKGVLQRFAPGVICIDLFHDLPAYQIRSGAWLVERCLPFMPDAAVWLGVVDPGVGSARRALVAEWAGRYFVGPDNGLFSAILGQPGCRVRALLLPENLGATFHGRDLFAPVAARLALGERFDHLGTELLAPVVASAPGWQELGEGCWQAEVMLVDHYGNLITALPGALLGDGLGGLGLVQGDLSGVSCGELVTTFSSMVVGQAGLVVGGFGTVEVVVNQGRADQRFGCGLGAVVRVKKSAGM